MRNNFFNGVLVFCFYLLVPVACNILSVNKNVAPVSQEMVDSLAIDSMALQPAVKKEPYRGSRTLLNDLLHTKLEVSFDAEQHQLHGKATLEFKPYFYPQNQLILDAKGFDIHDIQLLGADTAKALSYQYDSLRLQIDLGKTYTRDDHFFVEITYTANPDRFPQGGSQAITADKGLYFIDNDSSEFQKSKPFQIWTQGETESNSRWFPTIDSPNERTTQEMYITVDNQYTTLSNGTLVYSEFENDSTRTDYWKMDIPHAPYLFTMVVGKFAKVEDAWENIPVNYYVEPAYEPYAKDIFGNTPEMIGFFSEKLNMPFPWSKYAQIVVRDFVSGAMENTTASTFMEGLQVDDRELLDSNWDDIIAHELFHQWFGDYVTCESWANLPLNESMATYGEYLWYEYKYGPEAADYSWLEQASQYFEEAEQKQENLIRFYYDDKEDMFDSHSYAKGGLISHMLRKYVGEEAFYAALNYYLQRNALQSVEVHELRMAFEKVTGEDLNWFFNQWFLAAGHPQLKIEKSYKNGVLNLHVQQLQDTVHTPVYKLPLYIDIWVKDKQQRHPIVIETTNENFEFELEAAPQLVVFDGESQLLAKIDYPRTAEEMKYQYYHSDKVLPRYDAAVYFASNSIKADTLIQGSTIMLDALTDNFWAVRRVAVNSFEEYDGEKKTEVIGKLREVAQNDPKSMVRADAITALSTLDPANNKDLFKAGLNDLSYAVVGTSIAAYAATEATDKKELFDNYTTYNNFNVVMALADYYVEEKQPDKFSWFTNKLKEVDTETLYYLINYFGRYLLFQDGARKKQGLDMLLTYAEKYPAFYIRLTAYRTLGFFTDLPNIDQKRNNIRKNEKDERLQLIYNNES